MSKQEMQSALETMLEELRRATAMANHADNAPTQAPPPVLRKKGNKVVTRELVERLIEKVERI